MGPKFVGQQQVMDGWRTGAMVCLLPVGVLLAGWPAAALSIEIDRQCMKWKREGQQAVGNWCCLCVESAAAGGQQLFSFAVSLLPFSSILRRMAA
jgi:hypothetical protein